MLIKNVILTIFLLLLVNKVGGERRLIHETSKYDSNTILVSTIDGFLTAIDVVSGTVKWRYNEGPVLNSPKIVQQDFSYIPNPRTGELYAIVDKKLNKLPFTIPQLVTISPCKSSDGILYSGYKKDVWISIDPDSGVHHETVPPQTLNSCPVGHKPETVFIGRTEYKIVMTDTKKENRLWNASFVDYSSHLLPIDEEYPFQHFHSSADGRIITFNNASKEMLWKIDLESVIVNMYLLKKDGMHKLPTVSVGTQTYNILEEDVSAFISTEWNEEYLGTGARSVSYNQNLLQTLFIGDSEFGFYALNSFVDKKINTFQLKTLGPLLIDGPAQNANRDPNVLQPRLPEDIQLEESVYQSTSGEFLLLGHHEIPPLLMKAIVTGQDNYVTHLPFLTYQQNAQKRQSGLLPNKAGSDKRIAGPTEDGEFSWEEIFYQIWNKSPYVVIGFFALIFILSIVAVFHYAKHSTMQEILASKTESLPPSYGRVSLNAQTNSTGSLGSFGEVLDGIIQVGKLSYNPESVLGKGCEGTKVFRGTFDGREVAVKRVVSDQIKLTSREIELLRRSDAHRNVIRYFCSETDSNFFYIALELCDHTLNDYVLKSAVRENFVTDAREILRQATDGIVHLHSISIVHRDLKPQNILLSLNSKGYARAMISDFGLCKMVKYEHASVSKASGLTGTDGWIAPEVLKSDSKSVTFAVDVFSLGCIFYYVLSEGMHPFGDLFNRQNNILKGYYSLEKLKMNSDYVALNAIEKMIENEPFSRPPTHAVANHPIFWSKERQLQFFMDVSDRIEKEDENSIVMRNLERDASMVVKGTWINHICSLLKEDLCRHRSYIGVSVKDLLRAMRNKKHHYRELTDDLRNSLGPIPDEFVSYFTSRFPLLLIYTFKVMALCANESVFYTYYPEESKSFCERMIRDEIADDFITHGSPKRNVKGQQLLKRQTASTPPQFQQIQQKTVQISTPAAYSLQPLPHNWRDTPIDVANIDLSKPPPAPGFLVQPATLPEQKTTRQRKRTRRKKGFGGLSETIDEQNDTVDGKEDEAGDKDD